MSSDLLIILGVEGVLGSGISCQNRMSNVDIMGIDLPEVTRLNQIKYYISCDVRNKHQIQSTVDQIPIHEYEKIILISCIGKFGVETFKTGLTQAHYICTVSQQTLSIVQVFAPAI
jgi:hypothetical protein